MHFSGQSFPASVGGARVFVNEYQIMFGVTPFDISRKVEIIPYYGTLKKILVETLGEQAIVDCGRLLAGSCLPWVWRELPRSLAAGVEDQLRKWYWLDPRHLKQCNDAETHPPSGFCMQIC